MTDIIWNLANLHTPTALTLSVLFEKGLLLTVNLIFVKIDWKISEPQLTEIFVEIDCKISEPQLTEIKRLFVSSSGTSRHHFLHV